MHGIIHLELQKFVTERYGEQAWQTLTKQAELGEEIFTPLRAYPDELMFRLVRVAEELTRTPAQEILEAFGETSSTVTSRCTAICSGGNGVRSMSSNTPRRPFIAWCVCGSPAQSHRCSRRSAPLPTKSCCSTTHPAVSVLSRAESAAASPITSGKPSSSTSANAYTGVIPGV